MLADYYGENDMKLITSKGLSMKRERLYTLLKDFFPSVEEWRILASIRIRTRLTLASVLATIGANALFVPSIQLPGYIFSAVVVFFIAKTLTSRARCTNYSKRIAINRDRWYEVSINGEPVTTVRDSVIAQCSSEASRTTNWRIRWQKAKRRNPRSFWNDAVRTIFWRMCYLLRQMRRIWPAVISLARFAFKIKAMLYMGTLFIVVTHLFANLPADEINLFLIFSTELPPINLKSETKWLISCVLFAIIVIIFPLLTGASKRFHQRVHTRLRHTLGLPLGKITIVQIAKNSRSEAERRDRLMSYAMFGLCLSICALATLGVDVDISKNVVISFICLLIVTMWLAGYTPMKRRKQSVIQISTG